MGVRDRIMHLCWFVTEMPVSRPRSCPILGRGPLVFRDLTPYICRVVSRLCSLHMSRHMREHQIVDEVEALLPGPSEVQLGAHLRELRESLGLSVDELAARCGLEPTALAAIESGSHQADVDTLRLLATGLGIRLGVIFSLWERGGVGVADLDLEREP